MSLVEIMLATVGLSFGVVIVLAMVLGAGWLERREG